MSNDMLQSQPVEKSAQTNNSAGLAGKKPLTFWLSLLGLISLLVLFALGLGLRLYDLTDPPIDFHPTRQLRSAIIARGMYYQILPDVDPEVRQRAIAFWNSTGQYEPSILEFLVARIYRVMEEEQPWVARIINSLFWIIAGIALYDLVRRATSSGAALISLAYFLILPFAVQASRSFQPDPGMVMWMVLSAYSFYRWSEKPGWKWAIFAGFFGGIAVLTKFVAAYILGVTAVVMVIYTLGSPFRARFWRNPQLWTMAILMISPALLFYLGRQGRASEYFQDWTISLSHLLVEAQFYVRWLNLVQNLMGLTALLLSLVGVVIAVPRFRTLLIGLWVGYGVYGLFLPYQMYTHSYYHLQLVPIIALSLAPVADLILQKVRREKVAWQALLVVVLVTGLVFSAWVSITNLKSADYRSEPEHWQQIAALLPGDGGIIALTQEYGYPLVYYGWRKVALWPNRGERNLSSLRDTNAEKAQQAFADFFAKRTEGRSYFLITAFNQLNDQPDLKQFLQDNYPVLAEGNGYLIYDLRSPLQEAPSGSP